MISMFELCAFMRSSDKTFIIPNVAEHGTPAANFYADFHVPTISGLPLPRRPGHVFLLFHWPEQRFKATGAGPLAGGFNGA